MELLLNSNALHIPLADESVDCCITSPPYFGLRDYLTAKWIGSDPICDHKQATARNDGGRENVDGFHGSAREDSDKGAMNFRSVCGKCGAVRVDAQLGLEETPEEYVANMVAVFEEVKRILKPHGTLFLNIGDSYAGSGGAGSGYLKPKDLIGIPWMLAFALRADGWYLRSDIIWAKPNPMPESVTDRPTKSHEYLFLLSKQPKYYYDADAIRENTDVMGFRRGTAKPLGGVVGEGRNDRETFMDDKTWFGRNRRTVWEIATQPYSGAHFATFPMALVEPCIKAGSSEKGVCPQCGKPWERVVEVGDRDAPPPDRVMKGWQATCDHNEIPRPAIVFDPFVGSGTTLLAARQLKRHGIGTDLSFDYLHDQARHRLELDPGVMDGRPSDPVVTKTDDLPLFAQVVESNRIVDEMLGDFDRIVMETQRSQEPPDTPDS